jgi:hypothetical protein
MVWKEAFVGAQPRRPSPLRLGEFHHIVGNICRAEAVGVVNDHSGASRNAHPTAISAAILGFDAVQDLLGQGGQQIEHGAQPARVLGKKDVGRRVLAFFQEGGGYLGGAAPADIYLNSRYGFKLFDNGTDQAFAAARVNHQLLRPGSLVVERVLSTYRRSTGAEQQAGDEQVNRDCKLGFHKGKSSTCNKFALAKYPVLIGRRSFAGIFAVLRR